MSIYTIADLHLSKGEDKPMDIFGPGWENYMTLIEENWKNTVSEDDTVIIPGDISWALSTEEALCDLSFVNGLPGRKILMKGNHEYWWNTKAKLNELKRKNHLDSLFFFHNDGFYDEKHKVAIAGTRGWLIPGDQNYNEKEDEKIYKREVIRLTNSLKAAAADSLAKGVQDPEMIVFLHYPPFNRKNCDNGFTTAMEKYNVSKCYYGHLHGASARIIPPEEIKIPCECVSGDRVRFMPVKVV